MPRSLALCSISPLPVFWTSRALSKTDRFDSSWAGLTVPLAAATELDESNSGPRARPVTTWVTSREKNLASRWRKISRVLYREALQAYRSQELCLSGYLGLVIVGDTLIPENKLGEELPIMPLPITNGLEVASIHLGAAGGGSSCLG